MNRTEQYRLRVLQDVLDGRLPRAQAAALLGIGERQVRRILADYRRKGAAALAHGNRGRKPHNAVPAAAVAAVVVLAGERYAGFNHMKFTHANFTKLLAEREDIHLSRQTVSRLLKRFGPVIDRHSPPPGNLFQRNRVPQEGMLLHFDVTRGSWLEDPEFRFELLLAMDDATTTVANAVFRPEEDARGPFGHEENARGYFLLMEGVISSFGIPLAIHSDRLGGFLFCVNPRHVPRGLAPSQFARAMGELGLEHVLAHTPRAEGRMQIRAYDFKIKLASKLKRAGARTIDQANTVLRDFWPLWNARFRESAQQPQIVYRPLDSSIRLEWTLCFKNSYRVDMDDTVRYPRRTLQLLPGRERPSFADALVEVLERSDGRIQIQYGAEVISHREAPPGEGFTTV